MEEIRMELYLDSCTPAEISLATSWGLISGVTTNPGLISTGGPDPIKTLSRVLEVSPGPVLAQVIGSTDRDSLVRQACWLHSLSDKIVVKLPISVAGIQALLQLKQEVPDLRIAVTVISSIAQAYLAGRAGADIAAVFNGPWDQASDTAQDMITPIKKIYANYGFKTKVLSCGRFPRLFAEVAAAGTDICTMRMEYLSMLYEHPFTDKRLEVFGQKWRQAIGEITWPEK
jgi:transaldolase